MYFVNQLYDQQDISVFKLDTTIVMKKASFANLVLFVHGRT